MNATPFDRLVVLDGMPRSGTSWLAQIVESCPLVRYRLSPLFAYEFKGRIDASSNRQDWLQLLADVYASDNVYMTRKEERADGRYPVFRERVARPPVLALKFDRFHDLLPKLLQYFADDELRVVFLVRHPCGAIHSWLTAPREFPPSSDPLQHWRHGTLKKREYGDCFGFEDWKRVTLLHLELARTYPRNVRVLRYESLVADARRQTALSFAFLDLPLTEQTEAFLHASTTRHHPDVYAVYKHQSVKDRWRRELHGAIRDAILAELRGTPLAVFIDDEGLT